MRFKMDQALPPCINGHQNSMETSQLSVAVAAHGLRSIRKHMDKLGIRGQTNMVLQSLGNALETTSRRQTLGLKSFKIDQW